MPDYGYVDSKFPDLYSIRLVRAEGSSLETELILYVCEAPDKECRGRASGKVSRGKNFLAETVDR